MRRLKIDKNTKIAYWQDEKDEIEKKQESKEKSKEEKKLEKKNYYIEFASLILLILTLVFNVVLYNRDLKISERQLKIEENDREPHFYLECENVWEKLEETKGTDRIAKTKYTLVNNGGNISNVFYIVESYVIFYIPTGVENEWYIFKYRTSDFEINHSRRIREEEKGRRLIFYEYTSEKDKDESGRREFELGKYLSENLNEGVTHSFKNVLRIMYTDYMGKEKEKIFEFLGSELIELEKGIDGVSVGVSLDAMVHTKKGKIIRMPIDINDTEAVGKAIKEDIENWLNENKGAKGYKR